MYPPGPVTSVPPRFVIESLVRVDGTVDLGQAYAVAEVLGIADQTLRLAVRRTVGEGLFVQHGRGRRAVLHRTASATLIEAHDVSLVRFAYAQDRGEVTWDGSWRLLGLSVPEEHRPVRDHARRTLHRLGVGHLQAGVYLTPHDIEELLLAECPQLDEVGTLVRATTQDLRMGDLTDPSALAARIWDLEAVARGHLLLSELATHVAHGVGVSAARPDQRAVADALRLAWIFDEAHKEDPLLPPVLLPRDWAGRRARAAFASAWAALMVDMRASSSGRSLVLFEKYA